MTVDALNGFFDAHGGLNRFRSLSTVELTVSVHGFLFTAKRITPLHHARMTVDLREPLVALHEFPQSGHSAVLNGADRVEIQDAANCTGTPGTVVLDQSVPPGQAEQMQSIVLYVACVTQEQPNNPNN